MTLNKFILFILLIGFIYFQGRTQQEVNPPNILWITVEDIDPAWGCYGDDYAYTPNIDRIASEGYIFTQAFANTPICAPARSTLITGMYATSLGTQHLRSEIPVPQDLKILPEIYFDPEKVVKIMDRVGRTKDITEIQSYLKDEDPVIRYWGLMALEAYGGEFQMVKSDLIGLLDDSSPINAILSARLLIQNFDDQSAFHTLKKYLLSKHEPTVLHAAISLRLLDKKANPLIPFIKEEIFPGFEGKIWNRYKSWSYPMFIGMALDQARINCGEVILINK